MTITAVKPLMITAAVGECVHVAGIYRVSQMAEAAGFTVAFMGPAVSVERLVAAVREQRPQVVGVSYRLTPDAGRRVLEALKHRLRQEGLLEGRVFLFGGTPPVARVAREVGMFDRVFDGTEEDQAVAAVLGRLHHHLSTAGGAGTGAAAAMLAGEAEALLAGPVQYPDTLVERTAFQRPYPIIRHHFGLPSLEATIDGVAALAESRVLDVISLATDQNCQEHFFHPEDRDPEQDGAGGAPVRTPEDYRRIYEASRRGNYPLLRAYSGTRDILRMADVLVRELHLAWAAIPLTWYSVLDGRSRRGVETTIREAQAAFAWHGERGVPVESNESHHWSLRDAPDSVAVVMAFLAAYNARAAGVQDYVAQYMFNTPPATSPRMDLAKMLAKMDLIEELHRDGVPAAGAGVGGDGGAGAFRTWRQTRLGLSSHPADMLVAKGHLGASVLLQMAVRPHIVHVVAYCEADHAALPDEIVESVKIARGAIRDALAGMPDPAFDPRAQARRQELVEEAGFLLEAIRELAPPGVDDPWADAGTLARAVHVGLIDAPHLQNNPEARGEVVTRIIDGACRAVDPATERPLPERLRVRRVLDAAARRGLTGRGPAAGRRSRRRAAPEGVLA